MATQWKKFQFFEKDALVDEKQEPLKALTDFTPTCSTSGRGLLIFGDANGDIRLINRDYEVVKFQACEGKGKVIALQQLKHAQHSNILVSLGDIIGNTCIKIWKLDKPEDETGTPHLAKTIHIFSKSYPQVVVTCFSVLEDLSQIAVGLSNGEILLYDGHLLRPNYPKPIVLEPKSSCITGVHFREADHAVNAVNAPLLYVVTKTQVFSVETKSKDKVVQPYSTAYDNDPGGCELHCSVLNEQKNLICAKEDPQGIFFYDAKEKSKCFIFDGVKKFVGWFNNYLYLVNENYATGGEEEGKNQLWVYDLANHFVAFHLKLDAIQCIASEWGNLFILTQNGEAFRLTEKDLKTKMEMLFRKNLYTTAVTLAKSQSMGDSYVMDIFQMYGDHLYSKGDYDTAMLQYKETIGHAEPSYVIRKFLDAQRIHNLTSYLQELHDKDDGKMANTEHTTLLLNCYTKLKDVERLDTFVKGPMKFDVQTAITVLRQSSYFKYAWYLARKHNCHALYLKIQLEDVGDLQEALRYMHGLDAYDCEKYMTLYGKTLIDHLTEETTALLKELCVFYKKQSFDDGSEGLKIQGATGEQKVSNLNTYDEDAGPVIKANPADFIHIFVGRQEHLQSFLEHVAGSVQCEPIIYNTLLEGYLRQDDIDSQARVMALLKNPNAPYDQDHALTLCKMYHFDRGALYLYSKKLKLYHEVLQYHMVRNKHQSVIKTCESYGGRDADPTLWTAALAYFASKEETCEEEIKQVLENIQSMELLPPLRVIQILSQNGNKPLSVVKDYIIKTLQEENRIISEDQREILRYREDTKAMREKIHSVKTKSMTFQGVKCYAPGCPNPLSLPAVHFLCMHSFHQECVADGDKECPKCKPDFQKVKKIREKMKASSAQQDSFFKKLDHDGFACVAEYFGRGIFDDDAEAPPEER